MFYRPTQVTVDLQALTQNAATIRALHPQVKLCAVVKADAYGHGSIQIAQTLAQAGISWLAVAHVEEGVRLREAGIGLPILVLGALVDEAADALVKFNLIPTVFEVGQLAALSKAAQTTSLDIHLKVDTGMSRLGVQSEGLAEFLKELKHYPNLVLGGVMTHLQNADLEDTQRNQTQVQAFEDALTKVEDAGFSPQCRHLSNSAATLTLENTGQNLLRPGLVMYGLSPMQHNVPKDLKPLMRWTTRSLQIKEIAAGERVSYGGHFVAKRRTKIAVLPVGYADGYRRSFEGKADVLIQGRRAPVVGSICMDLCMVDVTDFQDISRKDEVVLMGSQGDECITTYDLANWAGTIPYEITCGISDRVPRHYTGVKS
jgi:alanine racemase